MDTTPEGRGFFFWNDEACKDARARALAESIGLEFPTTMYSFKAGLKYPLRRLVVTGTDTPENFGLLFGSQEIPEGHAETRKEVLMAAGMSAGSPMAAMGGFYDQGCPRWSPQPASEEEEKEIQKQVEFSRAFSSFLGPS